MARNKTRVVHALNDPDLRKRLVRVAGRILKSEQDSEDAAHDAVVQALVAAENFRSDAQVTTWMHRIAVNASLMAVRKSQRAHKHVKAVGAAGAASMPVEWAMGGKPSSIESELLQLDTQTRLRQAIEKLPEDYRNVIERCVYEEQTAEEAARALHLTASAVRTRVGRARKRLQDLLEEDVRWAA